MNDELEKNNELLRYLLAIELWKLKVPQKDIAKALGVSTGTVNNLLKLIPKQDS